MGGTFVATAGKVSLLAAGFAVVKNGVAFLTSLLLETGDYLLLETGDKLLGE